MSKRRNSRATEPMLFYPHQQHHQQQQHKHSRRNKQPDLRVVTEDFVPPSKVRKVELNPKSLNQETYIDLLNDPSKLIIFATGPAGTGKTMMAVLAAIRAYQNGECKKIIITRPAVGVDDEEHGFLPGDLNAKMAPWTRPIMDVFAEYYRQSEIAKMLDEQTIEIAPIMYLRGRTFKDAYVIVDEAQNTSIDSMKMLLTRIGKNSRMIVTGDLKQVDRHFAGAGKGGLQDFVARIADTNIKGFGVVNFEGKDIQREKIVYEVLKLYNDI